jgi:hypothetical protein
MQKEGSELQEQTQWWNVLSFFLGDEFRSPDALKGLQMARDCSHPDAQWLVALFPSHGEVTTQHFREVMLAQGEDPRALFFSFDFDTKLLVRSAELGYAPAQAQLATYKGGEKRFTWAQRAAANGDRYGLCVLASCFRRGDGCPVDEQRALELYRRAAELGDGAAEWIVGQMAFGELDWQRFVWWSRAVEHGCNASSFVHAVLSLMRSFEKGEHGRILHTVAPVLHRNLDAASCTLFGWKIPPTRAERVRQLLDLYEADRVLARSAIRCWSLVGCRRGVVRDVRVLIGQLLWDEAWIWSEERKRQKTPSG